jgi:hypothetical protein
VGFVTLDDVSFRMRNYLFSYLPPHAEILERIAAIKTVTRSSHSNLEWLPLRTSQDSLNQYAGPSVFCQEKGSSFCGEQDDEKRSGLS